MALTKQNSYVVFHEIEFTKWGTGGGGADRVRGVGWGMAWGLAWACDGVTYFTGFGVDIWSGPCYSVVIA